MANKTSEAQLKATKKYFDNSDRITLVIPKGTKERIKKLGYKPQTFIKELTLNELDKLERITNK